jgi:hypothetical protein
MEQIEKGDRDREEDSCRSTSHDCGFRKEGLVVDVRREA